MYPVDHPRDRVALVLSQTCVHRVGDGIRNFGSGKRDYWVVDNYRPADELRRMLEDWRPAGIITQAIPAIPPAILNSGIPIVVLAYDGPMPKVGRVDVDDIAIGRVAADHLLETGLRNFAYFGKDEHYCAQRLVGFRARLRAAPIASFSSIKRPKVNRQLIEYWHDRDEKVEHWLKELPKPVGVFAAHDPMGRYLAEACRHCGFRIPEDVAIVAADGDDLVCHLTHPPLSSVRIPWNKVGFEAARLMEQILATGKVPRKPVLIPPDSVSARLSSDLLAVAQPRLQQALRTIRERACEGLTVKELLEVVPVTRRRLEQEFQAHLKRTPRDEIIRVRIQTARELLSRTDLSMPFVAERCGFGSAERFSVVFSNEEGIPPTRYRERFRMRSGGPRRKTNR